MMAGFPNNESGHRGLFFFFQAEDGIRDSSVTGVQTCALPICNHPRRCTIFLMLTRRAFLGSSALLATELFGAPADSKSSPASPSRDLEKLADSALREAKRSEERRVGTERRPRWSTNHYKKQHY